MTDYQALARSYAQQVGISPTIFVAQIQQESGFNPDATSQAGAIGIAQFMPDTAKSIGLNPRDPIASLKAAASYDANNLKKYGDYSKMLAAYNCGGGCLDSAIQKGGNNWLSQTPSETQNYVKAILKGSSQSAMPVNGTTMTNSDSGFNNMIKIWGEYIAVFFIALTLLIVGVMLLAGKQIEEGTKKAAKLAVLA